MRHLFRLPTLLAVLGVTVATALPSTVVAQDAAPVAGLDTVGMDRAVTPGDDFFDYANGTWLKDDPDSAGPQLLRRRSPSGRAHRRPRGRH